MTEFSQPVSLSTLTSHGVSELTSAPDTFFFCLNIFTVVFEFMDAGALVRKTVCFYLLS